MLETSVCEGAIATKIVRARQAPRPTTARRKRLHIHVYILTHIHKAAFILDRRIGQLVHRHTDIYTAIHKQCDIFQSSAHMFCMGHRFWGPDFAMDPYLGCERPCKRPTATPENVVEDCQ